MVIFTVESDSDDEKSLVLERSGCCGGKRRTNFTVVEIWSGNHSVFIFSTDQARH